MDSANNALDLRIAREKIPPGSMDTTFTVNIDTSTLRVTRLEPKAESNLWNPDDPIRIYFNHPLSHRVRIGEDWFLSLDSKRLVAGENQTIQVVSAFSGGQPYELRYVRTGEGDTSLIFL